MTEPRKASATDRLVDSWRDVTIGLRMVSRRTWILIGVGVIIYIGMYGTGAFPA